MSKQKRQSTADITSEQVLLSPEGDGITGVPAISHGFYSTNWQALPEHEHDTIELCYCSRGSLVFECEGRTHTLLPNNVFLTQPGDRHHLITNHKGMRMYWLFFRYPRKGATVLGLTSAETAELVRRLRTIRPHVFAVNPAVRELFRDVFRTSAELRKGPYRTLLLKTQILRILTSVIASSDNKPTLKALAKITHIAEIIRKRPGHRFKLSELAAHAGLSESHFTKTFRQVTGEPPYAYLMSCRMETAKELLAATATPISEVAARLGFSSPQHLAMQFHKTFGLTASAFRAAITDQARK